MRTPQSLPHVGKVARAARRMRRRVVRFELWRVWSHQSLPLVTKGRWHGEAVTEGMRRCTFRRTSACDALQICNVLIPSVACGDSFPWSPREALGFCKSGKLARTGGFAEVPWLSLWESQECVPFRIGASRFAAPCCTGGACPYATTKRAALRIFLRNSTRLLRET